MGMINNKDYFSVIANEQSINELINSDVSSRTPKTLPDFFDVRERMKDKLYLMFGYPSKIFYKNIIELIDAYSNENDCIVDTMCGSGSTAIACIFSNRKCLISDGSSAATFISKNYISPINYVKINNGYTELVNKTEHILNDLYSINCSESDNLGVINYLMSSDVHTCPECNSEIILYTSKKVGMGKYLCNKCEYDLDTKGKKRLDTLKEKRRPIEVSYNCTVNGKNLSLIHI